MVAVPLSLLDELPSLVIEHSLLSNELLLAVATGVLVGLVPFRDSVVLPVLMGHLVLEIFLLLFFPIGTNPALVDITPRIAEAIVSVLLALTLEYVIVES